MANKYFQMEITFYNKGRCRKTPPNLRSGKYCPHIVIKGQNGYLGIRFIDGEDVILGETIEAIAESMYNVDYNLLEENVLFFILEGANKIGEGKIIKTWE
jgi:hypothetical protein